MQKVAIRASRAGLLLVLLLTACSRPAPGQSLPTPTPTPEPLITVQPQTTSQESIVPDIPEIIIVTSQEEFFSFLQEENWWGEFEKKEQLTAPHLILLAISPEWRETAPTLDVSVKKDIFYRFMLPLVLHANRMVLERRDRLLSYQQNLEQGVLPTAEEMQKIREGIVLLRISNEEEAALLMADSPGLPEVIQDLLYKLDIIPPGLALGQAAYESGYGTSRFAVEGNALFGQWTFGGEGLVPERQRKSLGDHRIQSFDWPFDSVRGYFINLMSHPAYEDFRRLRAQLRAEGKPLSSLVLADGLLSYSERGQEYVDELKGIIRVNKLDVADTAVFRDEPLRFFVSEMDQEKAASLQNEIEEERASGEIAETLLRMNLE